MNKNFEGLIVGKIRDLLLCEFDILQLKRGIRVSVKNFRSLLSYVRFNGRDVPYILELLRKSDFSISSSKNGIFIKLKYILK
jgi:hypothetical protein